MLPTWLPREVICPETVPGVFQQLYRVLRKMSLSLALQTVYGSDKTQRTVRCLPVWSHTGQEVAMRTGGTEEACGHDKKRQSLMI